MNSIAIQLRSCRKVQLILITHNRQSLSHQRDDAGLLQPLLLPSQLQLRSGFEFGPMDQCRLGGRMGNPRRMYNPLPQCTVESPAASVAGVAEPGVADLHVRIPRGTAFACYTSVAQLPAISSVIAARVSSATTPSRSTADSSS